MRRDDFSDSELDWHADQGIYQGRDGPVEPDFWDFSPGELLVGAIAIVATVIFSVYFPMGIWHL